MKTPEEYSNKLNVLLASYQLHYQNLRSLHWNIKGRSFFELHVKYEELYTKTQLIIDDIAERLLTINALPLSRFTDYLTNSSIQENDIINEGEFGVSYILEAQKILLKLEKEILILSGEIDDEGTNALMSDLIREKEKSNWMFTSWLNNKVNINN